MRVLGIDLGMVRTGVAVSDPSGMLASPVGTVTERDEARLIEQLTHIAAEQQATEIVVGLPRNMDGSCGDSATRATRIAHALGEQTGLPVTLWDERLTTVSAIGYLDATDVRGKKRKAVVDTVAATIILQNYLDGRSR